jgi:hypothetical protein
VPGVEAVAVVIVSTAPNLIAKDDSPVSTGSAFERFTVSI